MQFSITTSTEQEVLAALEAELKKNQTPDFAARASTLQAVCERWLALLRSFDESTTLDDESAENQREECLEDFYRTFAGTGTIGRLIAYVVACRFEKQPVPSGIQALRIEWTVIMDSLTIFTIGDLSEAVSEVHAMSYRQERDISHPLKKHELNYMFMDGDYNVMPGYVKFCVLQLQFDKLFEKFATDNELDQFVRLLKDVSAVISLR